MLQCSHTRTDFDNFWQNVSNDALISHLTYNYLQMYESNSGERRSLAGELPLPALDLQLMRDHYCG